MKRVSILVILFAIIPLSVFSQVTGKIRGKIVDGTNGSPLVGANIVVVGSTMGNITNPDGEYVILNVPAVYPLPPVVIPPNVAI